MATTPSVNERTMTADANGAASSALLISLGPLSADGLRATLANLVDAFPEQLALVATPDPIPPDAASAPHLQLVPYTPPAPPASSWLLSAADYLNTWKLVDEHHATACLLLGPESQSLGPVAVRALAEAVLSSRTDLA